MRSTGGVILFLVSVLIMITPVAATPTPFDNVIVSDQSIQFPPLPDDLGEPLPVDENWEVLYYRIVPTQSSYLIRGELRNISENPLDTPVIVLTLSGGVREGAATETASAGPGERVPFSLTISDDEAIAAMNQSAAVESFDACEFYGVIPERQYQWDFGDIDVECEPDRAAVRVSGSVTNMSGFAVERYVPTVFAFTEDGYFAGSMDPLEFPQRLFEGDSVSFEIDHGFNVYSSSAPFFEAGMNPTFVVAMASPVNAYMNCA